MAWLRFLLQANLLASGLLLDIAKNLGLMERFLEGLTTCSLFA